MDSRLQRRVQRYGWDKAAAHYERTWKAQLEPVQTALLEMAALRPGEHVLDVACGTGLVSLRAARQVAPAGTVYAIDLAEVMIDAARARARGQGIDNCRFERMDAEELEIEGAAVDVALCALGLMYAPDAERAIERMHRALRPGGRAVAAVWGERRHCGWAELFPIVDARVQSDVCPMFFRLGSGDSLAQTFAAAGFAAVRSHRLAATLTWRNAEEACAAAFEGGPVALAWSRFDDALQTSTRADYLASIDAFRRGEAYAVPAEFVVVAGTKPGAVETKPGEA